MGLLKKEKKKFDNHIKILIGTIPKWKLIY